MYDRQHGTGEVRGSRILALMLTLVLALAGSTAVVLPGTAATASAEEATVAQAQDEKVTLTVIGPDADGNPTYYLAPWSEEATTDENGWDFVSSVFTANGIQYDASDSQYGMFVQGIEDPATGKLVSNEDYSLANARSWILYVNGEPSNVGISSVTLNTGDTVTWYYSSYGADYSAPALPEKDTISEASVPMYRLYNPWTGEHLFTEDAAEVNSLLPLGWQDEGTGWKSATTSSTPVYRLYNPYNGEHLYTTDAAEYASLQETGWSGEGVKAYSDGAEGVAVYRLYNPYVTVGTHLYTTDASEYASLETLGWRGEGVALYGVR